MIFETVISNLPKSRNKTINSPIEHTKQEDLYTDQLKEFGIEYLDYDFITKCGSSYNVKWKCKMLSINTCGIKSEKINTLHYQEGSAVFSFSNPITGVKIQMGLDEFKGQFPNEEINLKFNCHGWTFSNGFFLINDMNIPFLLDNEYYEVCPGSDHDIVVFKCHNNGNWVHSAKKEQFGYSHKDWIKGFSRVSSIDDILSMHQYSASTPHYFKRKKAHCNQVCLKRDQYSPSIPLKRAV